MRPVVIPRDTGDAALNEGEDVLAVGTFGERVREVIRAVALQGDAGVKRVVCQRSPQRSYGRRWPPGPCGHGPRTRRCSRLRVYQRSTLALEWSTTPGVVFHVMGQDVVAGGRPGFCSGDGGVIGSRLPGSRVQSRCSRRRSRMFCLSASNRSAVWLHDLHGRVDEQIVVGDVAVEHDGVRFVATSDVESVPVGSHPR